MEFVEFLEFVELVELALSAFFKFFEIVALLFFRPRSARRVKCWQPAGPNPFGIIPTLFPEEETQ